MRRCAAALIGWLAVCAATVSASPPAHRLLVEQVGPTDASLRPFRIEVGALESTTRDVVHVTPTVFDETITAARRLDAGAGSFQVTLEGGDGPTFLMGRDGLASLLAPLDPMFRGQGLEAPAFLRALTSD